jgi:hypothetical protein
VGSGEVGSAGAGWAGVASTCARWGGVGSAGAGSAWGAAAGRGCASTIGGWIGALGWFVASDPQQSAAHGDGWQQESQHRLRHRQARAVSKSSVVTSSQTRIGRIQRIVRFHIGSSAISDFIAWLR